MPVVLRWSRIQYQQSSCRAANISCTYKINKKLHLELLLGGTIIQQHFNKHLHPAVVVSANQSSCSPFVEDPGVASVASDALLGVVGNKTCRTLLLVLSA